MWACMRYICSRGRSLAQRGAAGAVRWSVVRGTVLWLVSVGPRRGGTNALCCHPVGQQLLEEHRPVTSTRGHAAHCCEDPGPALSCPGAWWLKGLWERLVPGLGAGQRLLLSHCAQLCLGFSSGETFCSPVLLHSVSQVSLVPLTDAEEQTQVGLEAPLEISGATACSEQGHLGKYITLYNFSGIYWVFPLQPAVFVLNLFSTARLVVTGGAWSPCPGAPCCAPALTLRGCRLRPWVSHRRWQSLRASKAQNVYFSLVAEAVPRC